MAGSNLGIIPLMCLAGFNFACSGLPELQAEQTPPSEPLPIERSTKPDQTQCPKRQIVPKLRAFYEPRATQCGGDNQRICHPTEQQSPCDRGFRPVSPGCDQCERDENFRPGKKQRLG